MVVVVLTLLLGGAAPAWARDELDASLVDAVDAAEAPRRALEEAVTSEDPELRGLALAGLVRAATAPELPRWAAQGSFDPDPWVQRRVAHALVDRATDPEARAFLQDLVSRSSADPYVRLWVARQVPGLDLSAAVGAWRRQPPWRAAPLAWLALQAGDPDAAVVLANALATGEVRDDVAFAVAVGQTGRAELVAALSAGQARMEEELSVTFAAARALLGDAEGARVWSGAARSKDGLLAQEAVEVLLALGDSAPDQARRLRPGRDARLGHRVIQRPTAGRLRAARAEPWALSVAVRLLDGTVDPATRIDVLRAALASEVEDVRVLGCEAAARLREASLREPVEALRVDLRPSVRLAAAGAALVLAGAP